MDKFNFIEILSKSSKEEINKIIEEKGKRKLRSPIVLIKPSIEDDNLIHK